MKKTIFIAVLIISSLSVKLANAQLRINLNLNIGSQPEWGPVGYDHAEYYYLPDIDTYYYVPNHEFVYYSGNTWVHSSTLPPRYANYDLYHGYKVVLNQPNPWNNAAANRARYAQYRGHHDQNIIRDSHDNRYQNHWHDNGRAGMGRPDNHGHPDNHGNPNDHGHDDHGHH